MRTIYIRHAEKGFANGNSEYFKHDPGITEIGVERAKKIALKLIEMFGEPTKIVSSPYRRTRETSLIMNSLLKNPLEEIQIDSGVSEYLGNHNNTNLDVTIATQIHDPPHPETFDQMKKRVKKHIDKVRKFSITHPREVIWIITHGLIIKQIAGNLNIKTSRQLPYLTCFSILEKSDLIRAEFILFKEILRIDEENRVRKIEKEKMERVLISPGSGRDDISGRNKQIRII